MLFELRNDIIYFIASWKQEIDISDNRSFPVSDNRKCASLIRFGYSEVRIIGFRIIESLL
jgi:hypothetical protein